MSDPPPCYCGCPKARHRGGTGYCVTPKCKCMGYYETPPERFVPERRRPTLKLEK